jgi:uncharacterized membrane protein YdjX (TVP38/TMEM64 family)
VINRKSALLRILLLLFVAGAAAVGLLLLPIKQWTLEFLEWAREHALEFLEWAREHRALGAGLLIVAYVLACVLFIPGSLITLGAGFALGLGLGFVTVFLGSNLGANAAFLLGRTLARGWIEKKVAANARFRAIDQAVGEQGFKVVLLLRLSPAFPFSLLNYSLGLTRVSFRDYALATLIGMVPGIFMYVYLGSSITVVTELVAERSEKTLGEKVLFYAGLAATVLVTILVTRVARRALANAVPAVAAKPLPPPGDNHGSAG